MRTLTNPDAVIVIDCSLIWSGIFTGGILNVAAFCALAAAAEHRKQPIAAVSKSGLFQKAPNSAGTLPPPFSQPAAVLFLLIWSSFPGLPLSRSLKIARLNTRMWEISPHR
jgi:hypothetical protein